jgi:hypothetical protein
MNEQIDKAKKFSRFRNICVFILHSDRENFKKKVIFSATKCKIGRIIENGQSIDNNLTHKIQ